MLALYVAEFGPERAKFYAQEHNLAIQELTPELTMCDPPIPASIAGVTRKVW
jgi:hypothetical protein